MSSERQRGRECSENTAGTRPMTSYPASSVGRSADRCTEGRGFESHVGN